MGKIRSHKPVKHFCAITFSNAFDINKILEKIESIFGEIDSISEVYFFDQFTDYYVSEMGENLQKLFVAFTKLQDPEHLIQHKIQSNHLEQEFLLKDLRQVNIDPGYITEAKLVLATTKDYSHRLYLGKGVFGDLHLYFENGTFKKQTWTYPDYQQPLAIFFFNDLRSRYREQMMDI
ncbi:MAG: DUF4416 family protein [Calditrichaceae bacterium]|nr:DUF4416 family protein [Calditrichaceae bacterium]HES59637.1 DUF4416 family protein [Caldithrix sp.]